MGGRRLVGSLTLETLTLEYSAGTHTHPLRSPTVIGVPWLWLRFGIHVCVYIKIDLHIYTCMYTYTYIYIHLHTHTLAGDSTAISEGTLAVAEAGHTCVCIHIYFGTYIHTYTCIQIQILTFTYNFIHTHLLGVARLLSRVLSL